MALLFKEPVNLAHSSLFWPSECAFFSSCTLLNDDTGSEQAAGGSVATGGFVDVEPSGFAGRFSGVSPTALVPDTSFLQK